MFRIIRIRYLCTPRQMPSLTIENIKNEIIEKKNNSKKNTQYTSSYEYMYKALLDYKRRFN